MPSTRQLKSRIRSVKNTKQITKAMQMVAASKMRRAQEADKATRAYTELASQMLAHLAAQGFTDKHPLFTQRPVSKRLIIAFASDRGLAGAYNSNVFKRYMKELHSGSENETIQTITIGRRLAQFVARLKNVAMIASYENMPDQPGRPEFRAILDTARDQFISGEVDAVDVIYTRFISSIVQTVEVRRILPAGLVTSEQVDEIDGAVYEPSPEAVVDKIAYRLIEAELFQAFLDAKASEHSMRMLAMKNATDNAGELVDDLTLAMNKARQSAITQELAEISGGVEAMKE